MSNEDTKKSAITVSKKEVYTLFTYFIAVQHRIFSPLSIVYDNVIGNKLSFTFFVIGTFARCITSSFLSSLNTVQSFYNNDFTFNLLLFDRVSKMTQASLIRSIVRVFLLPFLFNYSIIYFTVLINIYNLLFFYTILNVIGSFYAYNYTVLDLFIYYGPLIELFWYVNHVISEMEEIIIDNSFKMRHLWKDTNVDMSSSYIFNKIQSYTISNVVFLFLPLLNFLGPFSSKVKDNVLIIANFYKHSLLITSFITAIYMILSVFFYSRVVENMKKDGSKVDTLEFIYNLCTFIILSPINFVFSFFNRKHMYAFPIQNRIFKNETIKEEDFPTFSVMFKGMILTNLIVHPLIKRGLVNEVRMEILSAYLRQKLLSIAVTGQLSAILYHIMESLIFIFATQASRFFVKRVNDNVLLNISKESSENKKLHFKRVILYQSVSYALCFCVFILMFSLYKGWLPNNIYLFLATEFLFTMFYSFGSSVYTNTFSYIKRSTLTSKENSSFSLITCAFYPFLLYEGTSFYRTFMPGISSDLYLYVIIFPCCIKLFCNNLLYNAL